MTTIILYVWSIHRRGVGRYLQAGLYKTDSVVGGTGPHKAQMRGDITFWGQDFMGGQGLNKGQGVGGFPTPCLTNLTK